MVRRRLGLACSPCSAGLGAELDLRRPEARPGAKIRQGIESERPALLLQAWGSTFARATPAAPAAMPAARTFGGVESSDILRLFHVCASSTEARGRYGRCRAGRAPSSRLRMPARGHGFAALCTAPPG